MFNFGSTEGFDPGDWLCGCQFAGSRRVVRHEIPRQSLFPRVRNRPLPLRSLLRLSLLPTRPSSNLHETPFNRPRPRRQLRPLLFSVPEHSVIQLSAQTRRRRTRSLLHGPGRSQRRIRQTVGSFVIRFFLVVGRVPYRRSLNWTSLPSLRPRPMGQSRTKQTAGTTDSCARVVNLDHERRR